MQNNAAPDDVEVDEKILLLQRELAREWGIDLRRIRLVLNQLADGNWHSTDELVQRNALSHRSVTHLLRRLEPWCENDGERVQIQTEFRAAFVLAFDCVSAAGSIPADPWEQAARSSPMLASMTNLLQGLPRPVRHLDHVSATPLTCIKRALFLGEAYHLSGAAILCLGDHDLTCLALCLLYPDLDVTVVDIDEDILEYIGSVAQRHGWNIRCVFADLRVELPRSLSACFDLVFTDPPYTSEGIKLFLKRGLGSLKQNDFERIVLCYGSSENHPSHGYKVQSVVHDLRLLNEAILPDFNRYDGAAAIGSSSDLYICRPTRRSWAAAEAARVDAHIYTQGKNAREAEAETLSSETREKIAAYATEYASTELKFVGEGWTEGVHSTSLSLSGYLHTMNTPQGKPPFTKTPHSGTVVVNLLPNCAAYLVRLLLIAEAQYLIVCVADKTFHALFVADRRESLKTLLENKYRIAASIRGHGARPAVAVFQQVAPAATAALQYVLRYLIDHRHARLGSAWREALISWSTTQNEYRLTKNQARQLIGQTPLASSVQSYLAELPLPALENLASQVEHTIQGATALKEI